MKNYSLLVIILFFCCNIAHSQQCIYTLHLFDSQSNSWDGAQLKISDDVLTFSYDLRPGATSRTFELSLSEGVEYTVNFISGNSDNEVSYELFGPEGNLLIQDGPNPFIGEALVFTACQGCFIEPPFVFYRDHLEIWFNWGTISSERIRTTVEYGEIGFIQGTGQARTTNDSMSMITGLKPDTEYDIYFLSVCFPSMDSTLIGPITVRTRIATDGGIHSIEPLASGCDLEPVEFGFNITNFGGNNLTLVPVFYAINGRIQPVDMPRDGLYTGLLGPDSVDYFFFDNKYSFPEPGDYTISVWTEIKNDTTSNNDTAYLYITNSPIINTLPYSESFEEWSGGWYPDTKYIDSSIWTRAGFYLGSNSFDGNSVWRLHDGPLTSGDKLESLMSPCFDFSNLSLDPIVEFALYSDDFILEEHILFLEYTIDGGENWEKHSGSTVAQNWNSINSSAWNSPLNANNWTVVEDIIPDLAGESEVQFRLSYIKADSVTGQGWQVDMINIFERKNTDLAVSSPTVEALYTCQTDIPEYSIRFRNLGNTPITQFSLFTSINSGPEVETIYNFTLNPLQDTSMLISYTPIADENSISITGRIETANDELNTNNSFDTRIEFYSILQAPYNFNFEEASAESLASWDLDSSFLLFFDNAQSRVYNREIVSGANWRLVSPTIGPLPSDSELNIGFNWVDNNLEVVELGAQDSICFIVTSDCFVSFDTIAVLTSDNYNPTTTGLNYLLDLSSYESETINIIVLFKNNSGLLVNASINYFNIRACTDAFTTSVLINYTSHPDSLNGYIDLTTSGGNIPYRYEWDTGSLSTSLTNIAPGSYKVTITDAHDCILIDSFIVDACPESLDISFEVTKDEGGIFPNGSIRITSIEGAIEDYSILWSNGYNNIDRIENLSMRVYSLTITTANNCVYTYTFNVSDGTVDVDERLFDLEDGLSFYPNPSADFIYINTDKLYTQDAQLILFDVSGRIYQQVQIDGSNHQELRMGPIKKGLNLLILKTKTDTKVFKLIGI